MKENIVQSRMHPTQSGGPHVPGAGRCAKGSKGKETGTCTRCIRDFSLTNVAEQSAINFLLNRRGPDFRSFRIRPENLPVVKRPIETRLAIRQPDVQRNAVFGSEGTRDMTLPG